MQKIIGMLAVLLAAQLVLAVGMSLTAPDLTAQRPDTPLLDLGDRTVDRLTIEGPEDDQLVLARQGEGWVLPETGNFPADTTKVDLLLGRLKGLKRGLPVATTAGAMKRFKVSDEAFERRVMLAQGDDTLATLYLGTSPGMRRMHARTDADDAVYAAEFGLYDAPVKAEDWEDKSVLQIPPGEIEKLSLSELSLSRLPGTGTGTAAEEGDAPKADNPGWTAETVAEGETLNEANVDTLVDKLAGLNIAAVLGREEKPEYGLGEPALVLSLQRKGGEAIEYRLGKREAEKDYVLKVSSRPEYFRLPGYAGEALVKAAARDQLVAAAAPAADKADAPADSQDAPESPPSKGAGEPAQSATQE